MTIRENIDLRFHRSRCEYRSPSMDWMQQQLMNEVWHGFASSKSNEIVSEMNRFARWIGFIGLDVSSLDDFFSSLFAFQSQISRIKIRILFIYVYVIWYRLHFFHMNRHIHRHTEAIRLCVCLGNGHHRKIAIQMMAQHRLSILLIGPVNFSFTRHNNLNRLLWNSNTMHRVNLCEISRQWMAERNVINRSVCCWMRWVKAFNQ